MIRPIHWLLDLIYPPKCPICGKLLAADEPEACKSCFLDLPINTVAPAAPEFVTQCAAPFRYEGSLRESLLRYKFGGKQHYALFYARYLAAAIEAQDWQIDLVTWVPVSRIRRRERGFDQAQVLARQTAKLLGLPFCRALKKTKNNERQSSITDPEKRRTNVHGVYKPVKLERFRGKRVLLIDDIMTTGATMSECAGTLRIAGAKTVFGAVAATAKKSG